MEWLRILLGSFQESKANVRKSLICVEGASREPVMDWRKSQLENSKKELKASI